MVTFNASFLIQILLIPNFNPIRFELTSSAICVHNMHKTVSEQYVGVMSVAETTGLSLFKRTESIILPQRFCVIGLMLMTVLNSLIVKLQNDNL